jgi:hypothetical protein
MTCLELRSHYEGPLRGGTSLRLDSAEVAAHVATCAECSRFVEAQRDLDVALRLVREWVPEPSASLDAAVLANYRGHAVARPSSVGSAPARKQRSFALLQASAAVAAIVLVAVIVFSSGRFFSGNRHGTTIAQPAARPVSVSQPVDRSFRGSNLSPATKLKAATQRVRHKRPTPSVAARDNLLPVGFHSLMYCDELSCSGAMEMIRVQLPSSADLTSPSARMNHVVFADVLVGSDGIARGIRIVE